MRARLMAKRSAMLLNTGQPAGPGAVSCATARPAPVTAPLSSVSRTISSKNPIGTRSPSSAWPPRRSTRNTPIGVYLLERLGGQAEVGDRVPIGFLELIVRDTDESGAVTAAGLAVAPEAAPGPADWPVLSSIVDFAKMSRTRLDLLRRRWRNVER